MKRYLSLLILVITCPIALLADPITLQTAQKVAQSFLANTAVLKTELTFGRQPKNLELINAAEPIFAQSDPELTVNAVETIIPYYVFNIDQEGFIIIAGDDRLIPVLAYSDQGAFDPEDLPPALQKWLDDYRDEIRYVIENIPQPSPDISEKWQALLTGIPLVSESTGTSVSPLIQTKWNQAPYYNDLCPYDYSLSKRSVTGCVATAMAQVMKYYNHPAKGSGFHAYAHSNYGTLSANFGSTTYNWTNMPNQLSASSTSAQKNAIATLMYHCGVSINMNYSPNGSSARVLSSGSTDTTSTEYALKTYFGYKNTIQGIFKSNFSATGWISKLKTELDAGRPIIYLGCGEGCHAFVCDGYNSSDYFHFNWGWGGSYDGYFAMNALNPNSGGIGGGSYSYNDRQQVLIGVEPVPTSTSSDKYDLNLYSEINIEESIWFRSDFDLTVNVANLGTGSFSGQLGAAVFNSDDEFVDFIAVNDVSLQNGYYKTITFSNPGFAAFVPGDYHVAIFYKTSTQDWSIVGNGNYDNWKQFEIYYWADIETYSDFTITTNGGKLIQGLSATVNVDVTNDGSNTFFGKYRVELANLDGTWAQTIQVLTESNGLKPTYHYNNGNNFTGTITVAPGTYLLEIAYQTQGTSNWYYAGSYYYSNPIYVIVEAPSILADNFENNNAQAQAYNLPVSFSGNSATKNTNGSNLHIDSDIDYYKIVMPSGYKYTIKPRLHDGYNSGNGQSYTVDALFTYSTNGTSYSESFDDVMSGNVVLNNGGTVYFKVMPYFEGNIGTYLLDLSITRSVVSATDDVAGQTGIRVYPNPANDFVMIDLKDIPGSIDGIVLTDLQGRRLKTINDTMADRVIQWSIEDIPSGIYFVRVLTNDGILNKKITVQR